MKPDQGTFCGNGQPHQVHIWESTDGTIGRWRCHGLAEVLECRYASCHESRQLFPMLCSVLTAAMETKELRVWVCAAHMAAPGGEWLKEIGDLWLTIEETK